MAVTVAEKPRKKALKSRKVVQEQRQWTFDEMLAELPETNQPTELWDGGLITMPAPPPKHQEIVARLAYKLEDFSALHRLGEVYCAPLDIVLTQRRVVQPDIIFISRENRAIIQDRIRGVPDLLVEVISPGSWRRDRIDKKALYEQHDVKEYWIVDLEAATIEVWALQAGSYELVGRFGHGETAHSKLLEGFDVAVDAIIE